MRLISKKISEKLNIINERMGTNYKAELIDKEYIPKSLEENFDIIKEGEGKLYKYTKFKHKWGKLKLYGIIFSKNYISIRTGRHMYSLKIKGIHKIHTQTSYTIDGLGIYGYKSSEVKIALLNFMEQNNIRV